MRGLLPDFGETLLQLLLLAPLQRVLEHFRRRNARLDLAQQLGFEPVLSNSQLVIAHTPVTVAGAPLLRISEAPPTADNNHS